MLHLQVDMMEELGLEVKVIDSRWGEGANEEKLAQALKVRPSGIVVHHPRAVGALSTYTLEGDEPHTRDPFKTLSPCGAHIGRPRHQGSCRGTQRDCHGRHQRHPTHPANHG